MQPLSTAELDSAEIMEKRDQERNAARKAEEARSS